MSLSWTELLSQMPAALLDLCLVLALPAPSVLDFDSRYFNQEQLRKTTQNTNIMHGLENIHFKLKDIRGSELSVSQKIY